MEPGPCRGEYLRWYYDDEAGVCKEFTYTGCLGNDNRFSSLESCANSCKHLSKITLGKRTCSLPKNTGSRYCPTTTANEKQAKWHFDAAVKECQPFYYSVCSGNDPFRNQDPEEEEPRTKEPRNQFDSQEDCETACPNTFPPEMEVIKKVCGKEAKTSFS